MESITKFTGCTISSHDCRCFEVLSDAERKIIEDNSVTIHYKKGEIISKQGGFVSQVMYMEEGLAKVFIDNGTNSLLLRIIPDGSFLGLSAISDNHTTFPYSAQAYIDSKVRQIDVKVFRELVLKNPLFANELIGILSANSIQIYGRFFCLTYKQAYGRLADILLCLADRIFKKNNFDLPLSRKEIAELSGMTPETVVRMLKKFNDEGLIRMNGKHLEIVNVDRLQRISETG
jgi:CRP/FNR family transcriptional regulator